MTRKKTRKKKSESGGGPGAEIVVGVVVALLVGSTAPWWWEALFPPPQVEVSLLTADDRSRLFLADEEFLKRYAKPPVRADIPSYHSGEETGVLISGLWTGDITAGIRGAREKGQLERDLFQLVGVLVDVKKKYESGGKRSATLDEAWSLFPEKGTLKGDRDALGRFFRILYPEPRALNDPTVIARRDELIASLSEHWPQPAGEGDREYFLRMLYDIMLWRTSPTFDLRVTNPGSVKVPIDAVELACEDFQPMKDANVSGPIEKLVTITFRLDGCKLPRVTERTNLGIAGKEVNDIVLRFESARKGVYRLRVALISAGRTIWRGEPFNLFFIT